MTAKRATLTFIVLLIVVIGLMPVLDMLLKSVTADGCLTLAAYGGLLSSGREWTLMKHSLTLSLLVTAGATAVGLPLGILLAKTDLPLRRFFTVLFVVPLLVPPYISAVSWFGILGGDGLVAGLIGPSAAFVASTWLFGLFGCSLVLFSTFMPVVMLLTMTCLRTVNPRLEEAGRLVCGHAGVLKGITIPLILPGVLLAAMLVFLLTFGEFGVPTFLRYDVFPVESFTQFSAFYDFGAAMAAATPLALVTFLVIVAERLFLRERTYQLRPSPDSGRLPSIKLGPLRKWLLLAVASFSFVTVILPILVLLIRAAHVSAYIEAFERAGDSLLRSMAYAATGASLLVLLGFFCGYLIHTRALPFWRGVDSLTIFLFALPGSVIGIGLINLWNRPWTNVIYSTPAIIIFGYLARYTMLTSRITVSALGLIPPSMEEAAQIAGASWIRRMGLIVMPMAKTSLAAGWLVGYIFCLRDMGITMMVYPPGHDTLPVRIFTLMANGSQELIAALCLLMIAAALLPLSVGVIAFRLRGSNQ